MKKIIAKIDYKQLKIIKFAESVAEKIEHLFECRNKNIRQAEQHCFYKKFDEKELVFCIENEIMLDNRATKIPELIVDFIQEKTNVSRGTLVNLAGIEIFTEDEIYKIKVAVFLSKKKLVFNFY